MQHYVDIRLEPDPEFVQHHLMSALYAKLHRALVARQSGNIAVTFPGYSLSGRRLGDTLRLIGPKPELEHLMAPDWLRGMRDHVRPSLLRAAPPTAPHRAIRRVQAKSSPLRLQRRQMRRHNLTEEQARQRVPDSIFERLSLPYVACASASTDHKFRLYLSLSAAAVPPTDGTFNAYGLSQSATVPWF